MDFKPLLAAALPSRLLWAMLKALYGQDTRTQEEAAMVERARLSGVQVVEHLPPVLRNVLLDRLERLNRHCNAGIGKVEITAAAMALTYLLNELIDEEFVQVPEDSDFLTAFRYLCAEVDKYPDEKVKNDGIARNLAKHWRTVLAQRGYFVWA